MASPDDFYFMDIALSLARRGLGNVWPNPAVGCVIVDDRQIVGRGWTQPSGRPHAEIVALDDSGKRGRGGTAYVTFEPCSHQGETPPCAQALIRAGIKRVAVAMTDPDSRVDGRGIKMLQEAGIEVELGIRQAKAAELNEGFVKRITGQRPMVTLKLATSLDGRIATASGESQWITGEEARLHGHRLRAQHDAILAGIGTVLADDPSLTCRLPGLSRHSPVRLVADSDLRLPATSKLVQSARDAPVWLLTAAGPQSDSGDSLRKQGIEIIDVPRSGTGSLDLTEALRELALRGITRLLVEGGGKLAASFLSNGLVDRIEWFRAPTIIGGDGLPAIEGISIPDLAACPRFQRTQYRVLGEDILESFRIQA